MSNYAKSCAQEAADELSREVDREAARIIREEAVPLWDAIEVARDRIRRKRTGARP